MSRKRLLVLNNILVEEKKNNQKNTHRQREGYGAFPVSVGILFGNYDKTIVDG